MVLEKEALMKLTHGALGWEWSEEGWGLPLRFTTGQIAFYSRTESDRIRSRASAGICVECRTDAEKLQFDYQCSHGSSRDIWGFDLYVDGKLWSHREGRISGQSAGTWCVDLPHGEKRLLLFLPNLAVTKIRRMELSGAACVFGVERPKRLLCLGDSIMQGYATHFPSMTLANLLALETGARILNQGMAGEVFNPDMLDERPGFWPDQILVAYGTNDWEWKSREEYRKDAVEYLSRVCAIFPEIPVTVLSPIWRADRDSHRERFAFDELRDILEEISLCSKSVQLRDGEALFPPIPELMEDRLIHPNETGFQIYAERLLKTGFFENHIQEVV